MQSQKTFPELVMETLRCLIIRQVVHKTWLKYLGLTIHKARKKVFKTERILCMKEIAVAWKFWTWRKKKWYNHKGRRSKNSVFIHS